VEYYWYAVHGWRKVKGTNRLSLHSFVIAIDLNITKSSSWEWDCKCTDEHRILAPHTSKIPQIIIDTFEKYGFIWGGKWYHYDTMHFEYRPELGYLSNSSPMALILLATPLILVTLILRLSDFGAQTISTRFFST
jgi:hypothetical protein